MINVKIPIEAIVLKYKNEIRKALFEITTSKTQVWIFNTNPSFKKTFSEYYAEWLQKLKQNNKKILNILNNESIEKEDNKFENYKVRYLSSQFAFPSNIIIYEDKVLLVMKEENPIVILINGKELSESYRNYFTILWESAKTEEDIKKIQNKRINTKKY